MNTELLSANVSMAFMAILAAALLAHLSRLAGPHRLQHGVQAATAAGLFYLFGEKAFGWDFLPRAALSLLFVGVFVVATVAVARRRGPAHAGDASRFSLLVEPAAMAYVFASQAFWKPAFSALLLLYFILELSGWLKGSELEVAAAQKNDPRPPLFPPKRVRGVREFAAVAVCAALTYVFAVGVGRAPVVAPPAAEEQAGAPSAAEPPAAEAQTAEAAAPVDATRDPALSPPVATQAAGTHAAETYVAAAGDTLKSIARKLYGKPEKWRALAAVNPGLKPGAKLKAGQVVTLPKPPAKS